MGCTTYVPSLLKRFTTADINALIAPRAHLSLAGNYDRLTPPAGLDRIDAALRKAYRRKPARPARGSSCATTLATRKPPPCARKSSGSSMRDLSGDVD